ncbi:MAG: alpha/beta hydrolase [Planctomycetota bacterium]
MNNYFIIHGSFGKPYENWFPWLEKELSNCKLQCFVPHFPTPQKQNFNNWEKLLNYYLGLRLINEDTVFITHSSASIFVVKYIIKNKVKIKGLISAAGFNNFFSGMKDFDEINKQFFIENSELLKFKDYSTFSHCFISDNDPYLPIEKLKEFSNAIKAHLHVIPNGGHFNMTAGYVKFVEILEIIKDIENL